MYFCMYTQKLFENWIIEFYNLFLLLCLSLKCIHVVIILYYNVFVLQMNCQQIYISNTFIFVIKLKLETKENSETTFS